MKTRKEVWYVLAIVVIILVLMSFIKSNARLSPEQNPALQNWLDKSFASNSEESSISKSQTDGFLNLIGRAAKRR